MNLDEMRRRASDYFVDFSRAYVRLGHIVGLSLQRGCKETEICEYIVEFAKIGVAYDGEEQIEALRVMEGVYQRAIEERNSVLNTRTDALKKLFERLWDYYSEKGRMPSLKGLENIFDDAICIKDLINVPPSGTGLVFRQKMGMTRTDS